LDNGKRKPFPKYFQQYNCGSSLGKESNLYKTAKEIRKRGEVSSKANKDNSFGVDKRSLGEFFQINGKKQVSTFVLW